jgi:dTDP-4-amino-4,6-dideoxygalactose transaminase
MMHSLSQPLALNAPARIPLFDATAQTAELMDEIRPALERVIHSQQFILGEEVAAFEAEMAAYLGCRHAIGVSSCTDALTVALLALGIGPGDDVVTTPYSFFASTGAVLRVGARPVFADIDPDTFNLDPKRAERALTPRTRAILPVHLFGQAADMGGLRALADRKNLRLVEDAAQAVGATFSGKKLGSLGDFGCFSFFPTKNLGSFGDGGLLTTNDEQLAAAARALRSHGFSPKHHSRILGGNFRLDALQAAVLRVKLPYLDRWNERRRQNAARYRQLLHMSSRAELTLPIEAASAVHVYHQFVVRHPERDALENHLTASGIETGRYYPIPIHLQDACAGLGHQMGDFPEAERAARTSLALPVYPEMEDWMLDAVADRTRDFSGF